MATRRGTQVAPSGPRVPFPKAIELSELCLSTSPTQPVNYITTARNPHTSSKEPAPPALAAIHRSPPVPQQSAAVSDLGDRLRTLAKRTGDYVPAAGVHFESSRHGPSSLSIRVADVSEMNVLRQVAAELGVTPSDAFDVVVDDSVRPSTSYFLTDSVIAGARADVSGELAVKVALRVLGCTVLDARVELWDLNALDALVAAGREGCTGEGTQADSGAGRSLDVARAAKGPRTEVRVCVRAEQFAVADAAVRTLRAALPSDCLCISAVVGESHNLTGPLPPLSFGAPVRVKDMPQPPTHRDFPCVFEAFVDPTAAEPVDPTAAGPGDAASRTPPSTAVASIPARYDKSTAHGAVASAKGRMTVSAYLRVNGRLGVASAGHELGPDPVACLMSPDTPLTLRLFVNPPACLPAPFFTVANSSDAYPNAHRIEDGDPPATAVSVLVAAHADVSLFMFDRETTSEEEDLVPVPVRSRSQAVLESTGPHPVLGLVPYEVVHGPLLFAGCTAPGQLRILHNVGLCVKRLPVAMSGGATPTSMFTYICVHDGAASSGPPPAHGDSGGPAFQPSSIPEGGGCIGAPGLEGFVCGECVSGGTLGSPLRRFYEFTPASQALAQLREALAASGDAAAAAALEFLQPRGLVAAVQEASLA